MARRVNNITALAFLTVLAGASAVLVTTQQVSAASGQNLSTTANPVDAHFNPKEIRIDKSVPWQTRQQQARTLKRRARTVKHRTTRTAR